MRRAIAGGPTTEETAQGAESAELRALRDAERELFPQASPAPGNAWPSELPLRMPGDDAPHVHASGLPPAAPTAPPAPEGTRDLSWLTKLEMPDLPVRWDERVVRYLEFFRDDPRGHATFANLYRHAGRWQEMMRRALRKKSLPEDLVWVAMVESGFEPIARSPAGAAGLWQFMPETGKIYGLTIDRWLDQRLSAPLETEAAADFLADLHRRFGTWELALAAYNMGYGGLSSVVRRYNTNDFWSLARTEGTLPWETTLYVPKILAAAVVAHNLGGLRLRGPAARAAHRDRRGDRPAGDAPVGRGPGGRVHAEGGGRAEPGAARGAHAAPGRGGRGVHGEGAGRQGRGGDAGADEARGASRPPLDRYVVRFGETLEQIAAAHRTTTQKLVELNAIAPGEAVRGGTVLLVPKVDAPAGGAAGAVSTGTVAPTGPKQSVVVPADVFVYPDRDASSTACRSATPCARSRARFTWRVDDLDRWNDVDPGARLQEGMTLQAFVADRSRPLARRRRARERGARPGRRVRRVLRQRWRRSAASSGSP